MVNVHLIEPTLALADGARPGRGSAEAVLQATADIGTQVGLLPRQRIMALIRRKMVLATAELEANQIQPASLDLRLGAKAYRVRASFLPGADKTVAEQLADLTSTRSTSRTAPCSSAAASTSSSCMEHLQLPESISGAANPKSSTGRLDIFTRLITDRSDDLRSACRPAMTGRSTSRSPRARFAIRVRKGSRLNQIRFRRRNRSQDRYVDFAPQRPRAQAPATGATTRRRRGDDARTAWCCASTSTARSPRASSATGPSATPTSSMSTSSAPTGSIDYWEPIRARGDGELILDPDQFYILASRERCTCRPTTPPRWCRSTRSWASSASTMPASSTPASASPRGGHPGSRAVLEVRSHEVPFILEDGQIVGRLVYEKMAERPDKLYGQTHGSNYQGQGLKLSKHFRA